MKSPEERRNYNKKYYEKNKDKIKQKSKSRYITLKRESEGEFKITYGAYIINFL